MSYRALADVLKAMAHPTRLEILGVLLKKRGCVGELEKILRKRQANISQHLGILRKEGIIDFVVKGKTRCYFLKAPQEIKKIITCIKKC